MPFDLFTAPIYRAYYIGFTHTEDRAMLRSNPSVVCGLRGAMPLVSLFSWVYISLLGNKSDKSCGEAALNVKNCYQLGLDIYLQDSS